MLLTILTDWGKLSEGLFNFVVAALPVVTFLFKQWYEHLKKAKAEKAEQELQEKVKELERQLNESQHAFHPRRDDLLADSSEKENLQHSKQTTD